MLDAFGIGIILNWMNCTLKVNNMQLIDIILKKLKENYFNNLNQIVDK